MNADDSGTAKGTDRLKIGIGFMGRREAAIFGFGHYIMISFQRNRMRRSGASKEGNELSEEVK